MLSRLHVVFGRKFLAVVALLLIVAPATLIATSCKSSKSEAEPTPVLSGPPGTTFPMPPINPSSMAEAGWVLLEDDESVSEEKVPRAKISDYQGKVLVLDLYATWCAPCRQSIPHLVALQDRYGTKGLQIVGLNVGGPDDRVKVADFAKEFRIQYPLGFPDRALSDLMLSDDATIPQTFIFDREGRLVKRFIGYDPAMVSTIEAVVQSEIKTVP